MAIESRTAVHTTDLAPTDFVVQEVDDSPDQIMVHPTAFGFKGPFELSGAIADYENQSGRQEIVWKGGTVTDPDCAWIVWPDDTYVKIKNAGQETELFCEAVLSCVAEDVNRGVGEPDCYLIPEMDGPTWRVASVEWTDVAPTSTDFSEDIGTDLTSLVAALNLSENLPDGWSWDIVTDVLTLCVPHGTTMEKAVLEGGEESDFTDGPDIEGSPASTLGDTINVTQAYAGGAGGTAFSDEDTEAEIEAQFSTLSSVSVQWQDADGDARISYKHPTNGWYHPVEKRFTTKETFLSLSGANADNDVVTASDYNVPTDATYVFVELYATGFGNGSGTSEDHIINATINGIDSDGGGFEDESTDNDAPIYVYANMRGASSGVSSDRSANRIKLDGSGQFTAYYTMVEGANGSTTLDGFILGWSR